MIRPLHLAVVAAAVLLAPVQVLRAGEDAYTITIRNHRFEPAELKVPSGRRIALTIRNLDPTPEEFESYSLNLEKVVSGNAKINVAIGPLKPGAYTYFGEFHTKTAQGRIVAK